MKLELTNLRKDYGGAPALRGLSLYLAEEIRILVLIGPSGGGKSTLLRILGGLEQPDEGVVRINGEAIPRAGQALRHYRASNGFLFQQFNLFPHLSALENISLPLVKVHRASVPEARRMAMDTLRRFGLDAHAHKLPRQLSGGQQQRVALARAVVHKPGILFLDEPTSALDPEMSAEVLDLIKELSDSDQDIILSTHEMGFARAVADRIAFLADGRILEFASPPDLFGAAKDPACRHFLSKVMRY